MSAERVGNEMGDIYISLLLLGTYRTEEAIKERSGNIERRFPLYDVTRHLTHMRNSHVPSKSCSDNFFKSENLKVTSIERWET